MVSVLQFMSTFYIVTLAYRLFPGSLIFSIRYAKILCNILGALVTEMLYLLIFVLLHLLESVWQ